MRALIVDLYNKSCLRIVIRTSESLMSCLSRSTVREPGVPGTLKGVHHTIVEEGVRGEAGGHEDVYAALMAVKTRIEVAS